jgi:hypothetical protein
LVTRSFVREKTLIIFWVIIILESWTSCSQVARVMKQQEGHCDRARQLEQVSKLSLSTE